MKKEELIGKKVVGFMFDPREYPTVPYRHDMVEVCVGWKGEIVKYDAEEDSYLVSFPNTKYGVHYPAVLIEMQVAYKDKKPTSNIDYGKIEHDPLDDLPLIGDGILMEVSNDGHSWTKRYVLGKSKEYFHAWDVENSVDIWKWNHARPITKTKITRKEFESKFEIID